ncbi:MAG TPA: BON domain-containing protein [Bryobacteraceae bacterium]|nr:BON domain-containing protein [Bryobacteraceae bacterium]
MKNRFPFKLMLASMLVAAGTAMAAATGTAVASADEQIAKKVVHEIRMYPRYTIWDNVNVQVRDGEVDLTGQVNQPFKKADLGRLAQSVPGVHAVTNELKVLPTSFFDDRIRLQVARAIYRDPALSRYGIQAVPPIHIIVDNGHVTLEGVVNNELEKNVAGMRASQAGLSFGQVINNLRVENPSKKS